MMLNNRKRTISVVITCGDAYHQYLPQALDSVRNQTISPDEILIVYDQTKPSITSFPYLRVQHGNPFLSRKAGFEATSQETICFVDADDYLSNNYLAAGLAVKTDNNIVFSDVQQFGAIDRRLFYSPKFISQENYLSITSLVSRESIQISRAFAATPPINCHEDWVFWRRLVRAGCPTTKQNGIHYHREHVTNRSKNIDKLPYHIAKGITCDKIGFVQMGPSIDLSWQWYPDLTESHVIAGDIVEINKIIHTTTAEYLLFYSDPIGIDVHKMIANLQHGVITIQIANRLLWSGTLVVVDILRAQLPLSKPFGNTVLI